MHTSRTWTPNLLVLLGSINPCRFLTYFIFSGLSEIAIGLLRGRMVPVLARYFSLGTQRCLAIGLPPTPTNRWTAQWSKSRLFNFSKWSTQR